MGNKREAYEGSSDVGCDVKDVEFRAWQETWEIRGDGIRDTKSYGSVRGFLIRDLCYVGRGSRGAKRERTMWDVRTHSSPVRSSR